jgi:hypothetical protein
MVSMEKIFLLGLLILLSYVSCARLINNGDEYRITDYSTSKLTSLSKKINKSHLLKFGNGTMTMSGVCNICRYNVEYTGHFEFFGVKFTSRGCTRKGCRGDSNLLENDLKNFLKKVFRARISGNILYLYVRDGEPIKAKKLN